MANVLQWAGRAVGSLKEAWDELLHPRGPDGRFIEKWGMGEKAARQVVDILARSRVRTFPSDGAAGQYAFNQHHKAAKPGWNHDRFVRDFDGVNEALRAGRQDAVTGRYTSMMDSSSAPLEDDVIATKMVSPEAFGLGPDAFTPKPLPEDPQRMVTDVENLTGKLIADRGYVSAGIGTEYNNPAGANKIRMVVLAPKGTKALFPGSTQTDRQVVFDKDQEMRVTHVQSDGQGGFHVYTVLTPRTPGETPAPMRGEAGQPAKAVTGPRKTAMSPDQMVRDLGGLSGRDLKDRAALVGVPTDGSDADIRNRIRDKAKAQLRQGPAAAPLPPPATQPSAAPAPAAPAAPAAPGAPAPRTEQVQSEALGGGAPAVPGEAPGAPAAPEAPAEPRMSGRHFTQLVRDNQLPMPSAGQRRREYNQALTGIGSGKKEPADMLRELDTDIEVNRRRLEADPDGDAELERDIDAQNQLADLIAQSYDLERRPAAAAPAAPAARPAPVERPARVVPEPVIQAPPPRPIQETTARSFKEEQARRRAARGAEPVAELPEPPAEQPLPPVKKAAPAKAKTLRDRAIDSLNEQDIFDPSPEMIREQMRALRDIEEREAVRARSGGGVPAKKAAPAKKAVPKRLTIAALSEMSPAEIEAAARAGRISARTAVRHLRARKDRESENAANRLVGIVRPLKARPGKLQRLEAAKAGDIDAMTKQELLAEAEKRDVQVAPSWTKDRIKQALRGEGPSPVLVPTKKAAPAALPKRVPGGAPTSPEALERRKQFVGMAGDRGATPQAASDARNKAETDFANGRDPKEIATDLRATAARLSRAGQKEDAGYLRDLARKITTKPAAPKGLSTDPKVREVQVENRIRAAYKKLRPGKNRDGAGQWLDLADLRDEIGDDVPRAEVDAALKRLAVTYNQAGMPDSVRIIPVANSKALTDRDRAAALRMGGENHNAIAMNDPSPRPLPSTPKPAKRTPAKAATKADLQKQADDLGLKYRKNHTKAQLEEMIANAPQGAKRDTTKDLPKEAIRGNEPLNEARGAEFADAWDKLADKHATVPEGAAKRAIDEVIGDIRTGAISPSEGLRRLENDIDFNRTDLIDMERELRANPGDKDLADRVRKLRQGIAGQERSSNFLRDHFRNEPSVTQQELDEVKADPQVGRDLAAAVGGMDVKTLGDMLKAATPEDAEELRRQVNANPDFGPAKGDTAEEIFDNAIKEMIRKKLAGEFDKPAKKVQAPQRPAGKPLNTPDVREIAAGLEIPEEQLKLIQDDLDNPKITPAKVGRDLEQFLKTSPVAPLGKRAIFRAHSERRDTPPTPEEEAEWDALTKQDAQMRQLAERLKVTRRKRATAPKPEPAKLTPEENKQAREVADIAGVPEERVKTRMTERKEDKAPASEHAKGIADLLKVAATREEGAALLNKKTKAELKDIAKASGVSVGSRMTSAEIKDAIIQHTVGRRLISEAIGGREAGSAWRGQAAPATLEVDYTDPALLQSAHAQDILANLEYGDSREDLIGMYIEDGIAPDMATMLVDEVIKARDVQAAEKAKAGRVELNPTMPLRDVVRQLQAEWENPRSREEVAALLEGRKRTELVETAKELGIPGAGGQKMEDLRSQIIQATVGRRLDSIATRGFEGTRPEQPFLPGQASKKATPEVPKADESVPLRGDPEGDNMRMHGDSLTMNLAQAYARAGRNGSANRMMDLRRRATTSGADGISPQEVVDELKAIRAEEQDPTFQRQLDRAIKGIDAPMTPIPDLPPDTPPLARKLMEDLHAIPYARKGKGESSGTGVIRDKSLVDQLAEVYRDAATKSRGESGRSPSDRVRKILRDQVHEVNESAFRIWALELLLDSKEGKPSPLATELRQWERGQLPTSAAPTSTGVPRSSSGRIMGYTPDQIREMSLPRLHTLATHLGLSGWQDMNKEELLALILGKE